MSPQETTDMLSIHIPRSKMTKKPVERLIKLGQKMDRSLNCLVVEEILQHLDRSEHR